jgi:hypothetical protein
MLADLPRWEVDDGEDESVKKFVALVVGGEFGERLFEAKVGAEVDTEDVGGVMAFGEGMDLDDPPDAEVEFLEVSEGDGVIIHEHTI